MKLDVYSDPERKLVRIDFALPPEGFCAVISAEDAEWLAAKLAEVVAELKEPSS